MTGVGGKLGPRETLLVGSFWVFFAALSSANRLLNPFVSPWGPILLSLFEAGLWAALTPAIFRLAVAFNPSRASWAWRVPLLLAMGLTAAAGVNAAVDVLRFHVLHELPRLGASPNALYGLQRFWFVREFIVFLGILAAGHAREYYRRYEARHQEAIRLQAQTARLQSQLAAAQLSALRMQLNPHFLFNTLNAISALVDRDPPGVRRMIARLSELLRSALEDSDPERTVDEEVAFASRYLEIMQVRFEGRLRVVMDVAPDVRHALVPTLILQPLVENAVKHGVARVRGNGCVTVRAQRQGERTLLVVQDDNTGPALDAPSAAATGVGLRNTAERLRQMYGADVRLSLQRREAGGASAELEVPYRVRESVPVRVGAAS